MKKKLINAGLVAGAFLVGFASFYYLMPVIVRHSKTVDVPYLKNMEVKKAKNFLKSLRLKAEVTDSVLSREVDEGKIVRTIPEVKEEVQIGSLIKLIVSKGPKKIKVPDIVGLTKEAAIDSLDKFSVTNRVIIKLPVEEEEKDGIVIKTKPEIKDSLRLGEKLTVYVGKEKRKVFVMPTLIGMSLEEAVELIKDYKLVLGPVKYTKAANKGVLTQYPSPGVEVTFGDTVKITVGRKRE